MEQSGQFSNNERIVESTGETHAEPVIAFIQYAVDDIPDGRVLAAFSGNHAFPPHLIDVIWKGLSDLTTKKVFRFIQLIRTDNILIYFIRIHILLSLFPVLSFPLSFPPPQCHSRGGGNLFQILPPLAKGD
jgi:hypothetical protein